MGIQVLCPHCHKKHVAPDSWIGRTARCDACGHQFALATHARPEPSHLDSNTPSSGHTPPPLRPKQLARAEVAASDTYESSPEVRFFYMYRKEKLVGPLDAESFLSDVKRGKLKSDTPVISPQFTGNQWIVFEKLDLLAVRAAAEAARQAVDRARQEEERRKEMHRAAVEANRQRELRASRWYFRKQDMECGPVSYELLTQLSAAGDLQREDLVWKEGSADRVEAATLRGLRFPNVPPSRPPTQVISDTPSPPGPHSMVASPCESPDIGVAREDGVRPHTLAYSGSAPRTDAPGTVSLIFGVLALILLVFGTLFSCLGGFLLYPFALLVAVIGLFLAFFAQGNLRVAGITLNALVLLPAAIAAVILVLPMLGVIAVAGGAAHEASRANINHTKAQLGMFRTCLERYAVDMKDFPTTEQGLTALLEPPERQGSVREIGSGGSSPASRWDGPYINAMPCDPWGNEYHYEYPPTHGTGDYPDIWSFGPDGEDGTEDDIVSWAYH